MATTTQIGWTEATWNPWHGWMTARLEADHARYVAKLQPATIGAAE
jgi:protein gp37